MDAKVIPDCCEQLKQARLAQKLSIEAIAEKLKLSKVRIEEIEEGKFDESVSPAFYRGYIRSYGNLLKLDSQELLSQFNELFESTTEIKSTSRIGSFADRKSEVTSGEGVFKWITRAIIFLILIAIAWGIKERFLKNDLATGSSEVSLNLLDEQQSAVDSREVKEQIKDPQQTQQNERISSLQGKLDAAGKDTENIAGPDNPNSSSSNAEQNDVVSESSSIDLSSATNSASQHSEVNQTASAEADSEDSLALVFVGDCWVDIRDSTGERLAYGVKENGVVLTLDGVAPFSVTLGDPSVVTMQFNGETVDLSAYRAGRPAKLNLKN